MYYLTSGVACNSLLLRAYRLSYTAELCIFSLFCFFFEDPTEATGPGENATEAEGGVKMFSCPVDGNPEPNITWYSEKTGRTILSGKQLVAEKSGCYTCVARNTVGPPVNITQCLIIIISEYNCSKLKIFF